MKRIKYLKVKQPIGTFYLSVLEAKLLSSIVTVNRRSDNNESVQRDPSDERIKEISNYSEETDATFPTPIIIAVNNEESLIITDDYIEFDENEILGEVIDGQHRLEGLRKSNNIGSFQLPVVLMFDLYPSQKAYIFSIINSKQTRVSMSLIYDLFSLSEKRSPYKTCHEMARAFNKDTSSPFYNRLKMLGKKEENQDLASLSQGTFVKYLLELISNKPDEDTTKIKNNKNLDVNEKFVLRNYFIEDKDEVIYKILMNLFSAVSEVFENEWKDPSLYIISKPIGFGAVIKSYPQIHKLGVNLKTLNKPFFVSIFKHFKQYLDQNSLDLLSKNYGSNEQARTKLANIISESLKTFDPDNTN